MKRIKILSDNEHLNKYADDCERICKVLANRGFECSLNDACVLWEKYSESMAAGWISMFSASDDEIFSSVSSYFEEGE